MAENNVQNKIDDVCETFESHGKQAELLAKITNKIKQFIRQENEDSYTTDRAFYF